MTEHTFTHTAPNGRTFHIEKVGNRWAAYPLPLTGDDEPWYDDALLVWLEETIDTEETA